MKPEDMPAPPSNFAEREWAAAERTKKELARKNPLCLRLLTPGRSETPVWNVGRKLEYVATLPLRILAALLMIPTLFGAVNSKIVLALLALVTCIPLAVWEIWVKAPWEHYQSALTHIYSNEALNKNRSGGDPVESRNKAFFETLGFFTHEALKLPGGIYHSIFGSYADRRGRRAESSWTLSDIRADFGEKVDAKVSEATTALPISPDRAVQIIEDDIDSSLRAIGKTLHPTPPGGTAPTVSPQHRRTPEEAMRDQAECLKKVKAMEPSGTVIVTPDAPVRTDGRVPTLAERTLAEKACYTGSLTNPYGLSTPPPSAPSGTPSISPSTLPPGVLSGRPPGGSSTPIPGVSSGPPSLSPSTLPLGVLSGRPPGPSTPTPGVPSGPPTKKQ